MAGDDEETVPKKLVKLAKEAPERAAFIFRGTGLSNARIVLTREEVSRLAFAFAQMVKEAEIAPGEVVCNSLPNSPERLVSDLGLVAAGVMAMNGLVMVSDGDEMARLLERAGCVALIVNPNQPNNILRILGDRMVIRHDMAQCRDVASLRKVMMVDCGNGSERRPWLEHLMAIKPQRDDRLVAQVKPGDMAFIFTNSGFSGFARLVARTHKQFIIIGRTFYNDVMQGGVQEVHYNDRPLGWLSGAAHTYVATGCTRVLVDATTSTPDPLAFAWQCILSERCLLAYLVPPQLTLSLASPHFWTDKSRHRLRTIVTGGMPVNRQQTCAVPTLADNLIITYSSTEGGFITMNKVTRYKVANFEDGDNGLPVPDYSIRIMNEKGVGINPNDVGRTGELQIKGPQLFTGYYSVNPSEVKNVLTADGWMKTSDIAYYNTRGELHIDCRKANAIVHGSYVIYPGWLERKLEQYPGVQHAVIVPVPDPKVYQEMCACVCLQHGNKVNEHDLRTYCENLFSGSQMDADNNRVPRYFLILDPYPLTIIGSKPDRIKIFAMALDRLKLAAP